MSDNQVIPEAAVDDAAHSLGLYLGWRVAPPRSKEMARTVLAAVMEDMLAEAWDAGEEAGSDNQCAWDGWRHSKGYPITNPYRPTP